MPAPLIRERTDDDLETLVAIGHRTHRLDRYPWRDHGDRLDAFLRGSQPVLGAWVAERDGRVVGQVVLGEPAPGWAAAGRLPDDVVAVTRLVVDPEARRSGSARALLATAIAAAAPRPVGLDVMLPNAATVEFYERAGWSRTGTGEFVLGEERVPRGYYLAPGA